MNTTRLFYHVLEKLGRKGRVNAQMQVTYTDALPPPTEQDWAAAEAAVRARKVITASKFEALFTEGEKHDIFRRASQSANTSPLAPKFATLQYRFAKLEQVRSDSTELAMTLEFLFATGVINSARRARIAAFLPPEN